MRLHYAFAFGPMLLNGAFSFFRPPVAKRRKSDKTSAETPNMQGNWFQGAEMVRARAEARRSAPTAPRSPQGTTPGTAQADSTPTLRASPRRGHRGRAPGDFSSRNHR